MKKMEAEQSAERAVHWETAPALFPRGTLETTPLVGPLLRKFIICQWKERTTRCVAYGSGDSDSDSELNAKSQNGTTVKCNVIQILITYL